MGFSSSYRSFILLFNCQSSKSSIYIFHLKNVWMFETNNSFSASVSRADRAYANVEI